MDKKIVNQQPAFPTTYDQNDSQAYGMTLMDFFAGQALPALIVKDPTMDLGDNVSTAYEVAHLMLSERRKYTLSEIEELESV